MTEPIHPRVAQLQAHFEQVACTTMRDMPLSQPDLFVEAVDFSVDRSDDTVLIGVLILPWALNLLRLPVVRVEPTARIGQKNIYTLGDAEFEFMTAVDDGIGAYELCSLESPIRSCSTQAQAHAIAQAIMTHLRRNQAQAPESLSRRGFLTGRRA